MLMLFLQTAALYGKTTGHDVSQKLDFAQATQYKASPTCTQLLSVQGQDALHRQVGRPVSHAVTTWYTTWYTW